MSDPRAADAEPVFRATVHCPSCDAVLGVRVVAEDDMVFTHPAPACSGWAAAESFPVRWQKA